MSEAVPPGSNSSSTLAAPPTLDETIHSKHRLDLNENQIRILRLFPGQLHDPIRCELYVVYLSDRPYYEALSYAWGRPEDRRPVVINGLDVQVTVNLEAALRRLRRASEDRHLWVDALCINQSDADEKSHQVNLMKEIYTNTVHCLLWLGDLKKTAASLETLWGKAQPLRCLIAQSSSIRRTMGLTPSYSPIRRPSHGMLPRRPSQ